MARWLATALVVAASLVAAGCGGGDHDSLRDGTDPAFRTLTAPDNTDAAGRAQQVPAAERIDVGGPAHLHPFVLAAAEAVDEQHAPIQVTVDSSAYGQGVWGLCLGSLEAAAVEDRAGWGIEVCEKSGIRVISLPIARGVWLAVSDQAAVRPEFATYMDATLDAAAESAEAAGVDPLLAREFARTREAWTDFLADATRRGVTPAVG